MVARVRKVSIVMMLHCSIFILLANHKGFWLASSDLIKVGYVPSNWPETLQHINIVDKLESYLTTFVNDDVFDAFYDER